MGNIAGPGWAPKKLKRVIVGYIAARRLPYRQGKTE